MLLLKGPSLPFLKYIKSIVLYRVLLHLSPSSPSSPGSVFEFFQNKSIHNLIFVKEKFCLLVNLLLLYMYKIIDFKKNSVLLYIYAGVIILTLFLTILLTFRIIFPEKTRASYHYILQVGDKIDLMFRKHDPYQCQ